MTDEAEQSGAAPRLGLRERKAYETRRRLLAAALDLMARDGVDGVTIGILADHSDIAVGTFYNYFPSREAIIDVVIDLELGTMGRRVDALASGIADPAEAYSAVLRHLIRTALTDPVWGWLVVRLGVESEGVSALIGGRLSRIVERGAAAGRFLVRDAPTASAMTLGALLAAMRVFLETERQPAEAASSFAENQLRALGIAPEDATRIAMRVLPELPVIADQGALSISRIPL
jgi:AcrR family transcriptional regulator